MGSQTAEPGNPATKNALNKVSVRERLLAVTGELFYYQGYYKTGVREIVKKSKAAMSSFYDHFGSKEGLALEYLLGQEEIQRRNLTRLMGLYPDVKNFFRAWLIAKKRDIRNGVFVGCPFAGFVYQSPELDTTHREKLKIINTSWEELLRDYMKTAIRGGYLKSNTDALYLSRRILLIYQGGVANWRLSENYAFIEQMEDAMMEEIEKYAA